MTVAPSAGPATGSRAAGPVWPVAVAVAVVLADSSVVTLGLPDILRDFDADVSQVAWVLTSYNLVLALVALPAAAIVRRHGAGGVWRLGIALFAAASLACALAPTLELLVAARCAQAVGGAAVVIAALAMLVDERGRAVGSRIWGAAGIAGAALGPACGGALTQLVAWEAIFVVQVPLVLAVVIRAGRAAAADPRRGASPPLAAVAALTLVSAALTAALFLLVLLVTEGWGRSPLAAAAIVSVMPLAALAAAPIARALRSSLRRASAGAVALAGGLVALGLLPGSAAAWTVAPQVLVGVGLGLALAALIMRIVGRSGPLLEPGAWTIGARHAGVVLGLVLLTPIFTADLRKEQTAAQRAGSAKLLDAPLPPGVKIGLAEAIANRIEGADGRLPDLAPAFSEIEVEPADRPALARLQEDLADELRRAATQAFSRSFLLAGALALLALLPIGIAARSFSGGLPLVAAVAVAAALVGGYLALGGGTYRPLEVRDPCDPRPWRNPKGLSEVGEQIGLSALDGAACRLRVTREELALALASADARAAFMRERRIGDKVLADALRSGLRRAVAEARRAGALSPAQATIAGAIVGGLPVGGLVDAVRNGARLLERLRGPGSVLEALRRATGAA